MKVHTFTMATAVAAFLAASTMATYAQPGSGTGSGFGTRTTPAPGIYIAPAQPQPVYVAPAQPQIVYVDCTKKKIVRTDSDGDRKVTKKEVCR